MASIGSFSFNRMIKQKNGDIKNYYRCNKVKKRGKQCPVSVIFQKHANSTNINILKTTCNEHIHDNVALEKVTTEVIDAIKKLVEARVKTPSIIKTYLEENLKKKFTINQIKRVLSSLKNDSSIIDFGQLSQRLTELSQIPEDVTFPFVVNYELNDDRNKVKMMISSKKLLMNMKKFKFLQIDSTFKLSWHGFPVLVIGKYFYFKFLIK